MGVAMFMSVSVYGRVLVCIHRCTKVWISSPTKWQRRNKHSVLIICSVCSVPSVQTTLLWILEIWLCLLYPYICEWCLPKVNDVCLPKVNNVYKILMSTKEHVYQRLTISYEVSWCLPKFSDVCQRLTVQYFDIATWSLQIWCDCVVIKQAKQILDCTDYWKSEYGYLYGG